VRPRAALPLRRSFAALDEKIKIDDVLLYRAEGEQEDRLCPRTGDDSLLSICSNASIFCQTWCGKTAGMVINRRSATVLTLNRSAGMSRDNLLGLNGKLQCLDGEVLRVIEPPPPDPDAGTLFEGLVPADSQKKAG
jgi:hypothetical protein